MASISQQDTPAPPSSTASSTSQPRPTSSSQSSRPNPSSQLSAGQHAEYVLSSIRHSQSTRNHVMKLHAPRPIDPLSPTNTPNGWTHPLKLHRRDPTAPILRPDQPLPSEDTKDIKGNIDLSVIAPYGGAQKAKKDLFKPKTKQVFHSDPQELQLRNEERVPWVLEDFDGKNTWVGTLEGGGASGYALFLFEKDGFKFVPVDRTYRFTKKGATQVLTAEEAEAQMKKRSTLPRWILKDNPPGPGLVRGSTGGAAGSGGGGGRGRGLFTVRETRERATDAMEEDLDYDATERFEDDEENPILEGDEEANKAIEERVRREMRGARNFESKEDEIEEDVDLDDLFEAKKVTKEGKRTKRYLKKLEGKGDYDTDEEEENPYASEVYTLYI
jgi:transcription initiation factor TFIIF subunit alpha